MTREPGDRRRRPMSWATYGDMDATLRAIIKDRLARDGITVHAVVGLFRGAMVLARSIAASLHDIPLVIIHPNIDQSRPAGCVADIDFTAVDPSRKAIMSVLLVDDISDSGETLERAKIYLETCGFGHVLSATLIHKTYSSFKPDFYTEEDSTTDWHVFPWEKGE